MDYKKSKAPVNTVTRNIMDLCDETGNIYESVAIIAKRANQISAEIKQDLSKKLAEFFPEVYQKVVTQGTPTLRFKLTYTENTDPAQ